METVVVVREDHPDGAVRINKSDMKEGDKLYSEQPKKRAYNKKAKAD